MSFKEEVMKQNLVILNDINRLSFPQAERVGNPSFSERFSMRVFAESRYDRTSRNDNSCVQELIHVIPASETRLPAGRQVGNPSSSSLFSPCNQRHIVARNLF
jgi:hypothetical protein